LLKCFITLYRRLRTATVMYVVAVSQFADKERGSKRTCCVARIIPKENKYKRGMDGLWNEVPEKQREAEEFDLIST
jgi:hypothetical protein